MVAQKDAISGPDSDENQNNELKPQEQKNGQAPSQQSGFQMDIPPFGNKPPSINNQ